MHRVLAGALALAIVVFSAVPSAAVTRTFSITGVVTRTDRVSPDAPDFTGVRGSGRFSFDSAAITGVGNEVIGHDALDIDFRIFGQRFTGVSDTIGPPYPALLLEDGTPRALDFFVREVGDRPVAIDAPYVAGFFFHRLVPLVRTAPDSFRGEVTAISAVPLPAALPLALAGAVALVGLRLRRRRPAG